MSKITDLSKFKQEKEQRQFGELNEIISFDHLYKENDLQRLKIVFASTVQIISQQWQQNVIDNKLNEFILSFFNNRLIDRTAKYTSDLNAVASLERLVNLNPIILGPGSSPTNQLGWQAGFYLNGLLMATPEFSIEAYARCFNLLLFVSINKK